jgi:hypothetical protein
LRATAAQCSLRRLGPWADYSAGRTSAATPQFGCEA